MPAYTQKHRLIGIGTPLGEDVLLLAGFQGPDGLSTLFSYELSMISETHDISFEDIVGKNVTVAVRLAKGKNRFFNGIISRFSQGRGGAETGNDPRFSYYTATMVPWFWLLTKTADSRIFQKLSVPDIINKIFGEMGLTDYKIQAQGCQPREYCVQYRETDFNFISRLLEEEGIYYYFEHENGKHTMVMADSPTGHKKCPEQSSARYQISVGGKIEEDTIKGLEVMKEIRVGKYTLNDYNFELPNTDLKSEAPGKKPLGPGEREIYDYPGEYKKKSGGSRLAKIRMEEEEAEVTTITGTSDCRSFTSGFQFDLKDYYRQDMNGKAYVLSSVSHSATQEYATGSSGSEQFYINSFTCIPIDVPFRPPRVTPKPVVEGVQTAFVVGPSGEEIYTDEHGRVKVQFHWDREGKNDDKSSCWIRVSQLWAGPKWGAMFIPRIGHEVIVDFVEGDPDRPIITGRVYHANNKPPYDLPAEKTKSTIKTDSSKGGGGFNELRFEDKKGEEQVFIHAEKNKDVRVKNDSFEWIGNERHKIVKKDMLDKIEGDKHLKVMGDHNEKTVGTISVEAGMDMQEKVGMKHALDAGMEIHLKAGMNVVIEAGMSITLKAGGGFIVIGPTGVTIKGTPVLINSGGSAGSGSGSTPSPPKEPEEADKAIPGEKPQSVSKSKSEKPIVIAPTTYSPAAAVLKQAAANGTPFCAKCEAAKAAKKAKALKNK